jgi:hypothetical protein
MTIRLPNNTYCKGCSKYVDSCTPIEDATYPHEGSLSICPYCGVISMFDKDLNLQPVSQQFLDTLKITHRSIWIILHQAQKIIKDRIDKN